MSLPADPSQDGPTPRGARTGDPEPPTGPPVEESLLEEAVHLARSAGHLTLRWYDGSAEVMVKGDGSPVTEADRAAERLLRTELARRFPADSIVGEEYADTVGASGRTWFIDPIDGTQSFIRGVPLFATLLALEDEHGVAVGVIDLPALGETMAAGRGRGCYLNERAVSVRRRSDLEGAALCTSGFDLLPGDMAERLHAGPMILRGWGDAYGYSLVASGRVDAMLDPIVNAWDVAPMMVILPEAGGRFTDLSGEPSFRSGTGLATNGDLHDTILDLATGR
ncbi:inositol monophosphatase family protein [Candidatus Spongiisocius sp.]|uniref:inositol monophosphatase family protein n=1 Tax=Candidatus Spongiisocius sp. TaxID=3101273 RepID=UPI003B5C5063